MSIAKMQVDAISIARKALGRLEPRILIDLVFAVALIILAMAVFRARYFPNVVIYDPSTNISRLVASNRDNAALKELFLGGFYHATAMATGSWPYELQSKTSTAVKRRILDQFFTPLAADAVQQIRSEVAIFQPFGVTELAYNSIDERYRKVIQRQGGVFFEAIFNQKVPVGENQSRVRTFQVRALANVSPVTQDNPFNIRFSQIEIKEIVPKSPRN